MRGNPETKPCEFCGKSVTKTKAQQAQRKYWTCDASCANKLRIQFGHTPWPENPLRGQRETHPCATCGKPVTRYLSERRKAQFWTCSRACMAKERQRRLIGAGTWKRPEKPRRGIERACATCGKLVYVAPRIAENEKIYCSHDCQYVGMRKEPVIKPCAACGKEIRLKPSQAAIQYCSRRCMADAKTIRPQERMHNGRPAKRDKSGYLMVWEPEHPNKALKGWQYEHRLIAEKAIGRLLNSDEHVDHINRNKADNRPENLQVLSQNDHARKSSGEYQQDIADLRKSWKPTVSGLGLKRSNTWRLLKSEVR